MKIELISIGDEILSGDILNTNVPYLSRAFWELGFEVLQHTGIRDHETDIRDALVQARERADVVVVTGGLGPTSDDLTMAVAAAAFGRELVVDVGTLEHLREYFEKHGRELSPENSRQALVPDGALALPNLTGTAPGVFYDFEGTFFYFLPGVPTEMRQIFEDTVLPHVLSRKASGQCFYKMVLRTFGRPESVLQKELADLFTAQTEIEGVRVGFRPQFPEVLIKLSVRDQDLESAVKRVSAVRELIAQRIGKFIYADDESMTLEASLVQKLSRASRTFAVAESCTGGRIADRITDVSGSSAVFLGGFVTYSNQLKSALLNVPPEILNEQGAVSEACARAMVEGLYQKTGADCCVAVTGIAGPTGGSAEKPVGTVFIASHFSDRRSQIQVKKYQFDFPRLQFKELVASVVFKKVLDALP